MREVAAEDLRRRFGVDATIRRHVNHANSESVAFEVTTPAASFWVKESPSADDDESIERQVELADVLTARYRAPRVVERIELAGRPALVFERVPAEAPASLRPHVAALLELTAELHDDRALAERLGGPTSAASAFENLWIERLRHDLPLIDARVPFVTPSLFAWMADEVDALAHAVATSPDFSETVASPTHGDLWRENVLVGEGGWWVIDWDDLAIGDPVIDDVIVLFDALGPDVAKWAATRPTSGPGETARLVGCARALVLDRVIDSLADWVELPAGPAWDDVRERKHAEHRNALAHYRATYGGD